MTTDIDLQLEPDAPWRQRFQSSYIFYTHVAATNPNRGLVSAKVEGETFQLYGWNTQSNELTQRTSEETGVYFGWLTPDGESIFYLRDDSGNEQGHLIQMAYQSQICRNATPNLPPFTLRGFNICKSGKTAVFNAVNDEGYSYYRLQSQADRTFSEPELLFNTKSETWDAHLSFDGAFLAVKSTARAGGQRQYSTLIFDAAGDQVAELWDGDGTSIEPAIFSPILGDFRLLATTNRSGMKRPFLYNLQNNQKRILSTSQLSGDIEPLDWSSDGQKILLRQSDRAKTMLHIYDLHQDKLHSLAHPEGSYAGRGGAYFGGLSASYFGPTGDDIWAQYSNSATPTKLIVLDSETGEQKEDKLAISAAPAGQPEKSVSFFSSDNTAVQGWLSLPSENKPFPTVISLHGGPHQHVVTGFDPFSQVWLDHGFAHFTINYRGSTGFGQAFQNKILGNVGQWELEDILAARSWLIEQGIAKPNEIILSGGSYGGFLTILALARHPNLWRAGIAKLAVVDWAANYRDCSEAIRGLTKNLFGGTPDDLPEQYAAASPTHDAARITAPLLLFHAENDSRATQPQMENFVSQMEALNKPIRIHWLGGGHQSGNVNHLQAQLITELKFVQDVFERG